MIESHCLTGVPAAGLLFRLLRKLRHGGHLGLFGPGWASGGFRFRTRLGGRIASIGSISSISSISARAHGQHGQKEISTEKYASAIRKKYLSVVGTPKWADLARQRDTDGDSDDEFFRETTDMLATGRTAALARGRLEYRKMKDLNQADHSQGAVITCAEFHPQSAIGLVAGLNGTASLFHVDGKLNPKMQSVNFKDFPIQTAHFSAGGQEFIVGSPNFAHFYTYDMAKGVTSRIELPKSLGPAKIQKFEVSPNGDYLALHGKFGHLHFLHARTKTRAFSLKMNAKVRAVAFSPDGNQIYSHGDEGEVYLWDIRGRDCVHRFYDDGCIQGTAITVSPDQRYVATGSSSGVVNLYSREKLTQARPKPDKIVLNLSTSISEVKFNPTSEILALRSMMMDNALKMLHVPSMSVFENFPSLSFDFKRPNSMDFSLNGGYLSIGNNRGAANLYRYTCNNGYAFDTNQEQSMDIQCKSGGSWSPLGTCERAACFGPELPFKEDSHNLVVYDPNGNLMPKSGSSYSGLVAFGDTVYYKCKGDTFPVSDRELVFSLNVLCLSTGYLDLPLDWEACVETVECSDAPPDPGPHMEFTFQDAGYSFGQGFK
eukprot:maker-scaffold789_size96855-snap-gene-0.21 protein:Tk12482 transcript:maker-scaffold789_size96855-snap-gene-0.21-mRNA-1 annotation:"u3 small nucleolar rna-associated protein 18 homolog"